MVGAGTLPNVKRGVFAAIGLGVVECVLLVFAAAHLGWTFVLLFVIASGALGAFMIWSAGSVSGLADPQCGPATSNPKR